jgi:exoribonuclease-2
MDRTNPHSPNRELRTSRKGTWVRLLNIPVEGKLVDGFAGLEAGERTRVQLIDTNIEQEYIDFKKAGSSRYR